MTCQHEQSIECYTTSTDTCTALTVITRPVHESTEGEIGVEHLVVLRSVGLAPLPEHVLPQDEKIYSSPCSTRGGAGGSHLRGAANPEVD